MRVGSGPGREIRRTAKSRRREHGEAAGGVPGDFVGAGSEGEVVGAAGAEDGGGGGRELREPLGDAWAARPVAIFVPPTVFDKEQAVFDLPVSADRAQQFLCVDRVGIEAGEKVARIGQLHLAVGVHYVPINTQRNLRAGKVQLLTNVTGVVQVDPQPAAIDETPFFSIVSAAGGRSSAWPRHCSTASSTSG